MTAGGLLFLRLALLALSGWLLARSSRQLLGGLALRRLEISLRTGDKAGAEQAFLGVLRWAPQRINRSSVLNQACLDLDAVRSSMEPTRFGEFILELLHKAPRSAPAEPTLTLLEAHLLRQRNQTGQALLIMDSQPTPSPDSALHRKNRGLFYEMAGELERSVKEYTRALEMLGRRHHPARPSLHRSLAQAYSRLGRLPEAAEALRRSLADDPNSREAVFSRLALAGILERLEACDEALACLEQGLAHGPRGADLLLQGLGELQLRRGSLEEAETHLKQARELNPHMLSALLSLGELETRRGRHDEALVYLEQALDELPTSRAVLLAMARHYEGLGDDHSAVPFLERAVDAPLEPPVLHSKLAQEAAVERLARAYTRLAREDDAVKEYRRALSSADPSPTLMLGLAELQEGDERARLLERAAARFTEELTHFPGDIRAVLGLGRVRLEQGAVGEAHELLSRATSLSPRNYEAWYRLGLTCRRLGQDPGPALARAAELAVRPDQRLQAQQN